MLPVPGFRHEGFHSPAFEELRDRAPLPTDDVREKLRQLLSCAMGGGGAARGHAVSCRARLEAIGLQTCPEVDCQAQDPSTPTQTPKQPQREAVRNERAGSSAPSRLPRKPQRPPWAQPRISLRFRPDQSLQLGCLVSCRGLLSFLRAQEPCTPSQAEKEASRIDFEI